MTGELRSTLDALLTLPPASRIERLAGLSTATREAFLTLEGPLRASLATALAEALQTGEGKLADRVALGVFLGRLGDPRLRAPSDPGYWLRLEPPASEPYSIGRHMVTNTEFRAFIVSGAYHADACWSPEGRAWRDATENTWPGLAQGEDVADLIVANQPVVGVSYYEAEAYAAWAKARLPTWAERMWAVRGAAKRQYPWGSPFRDGFANTREEALGRPCAVGLYVRDVTPDGVYDLAGNAGEWTRDFVGGEVLLHPGSWDQPSIASWAKASTTASPSARWPALGLRLARDT